MEDERDIYLVSDEKDIRERQFNSRKELLKYIAYNCNGVMNDFTFKVLNDETVETINAKLRDCCSTFDDIHTTFIFIPLSKEDILSGKADFTKQLKVTYHSIDTASTIKEADVYTWLSQL